MCADVYIDEFNLCYGALEGARFTWLDLGELRHVLLPKDDVNDTRCFTPRVRARPEDSRQPVRQDIYRQASTVERPLKAVPRVACRSRGEPGAYELTVARLWAAPIDAGDES